MSRLSTLKVRKRMGKAQFRERTSLLRQELLEVQADLRESPTSALVLIAGMDGAGKGATVQRLNEWMDPRWIRTHGFDDPSSDEAQRPTFWRYWRRLPPAGEMVIFLSAWYRSVLIERVNGASDASVELALDRIRRFEQMLSDDGMLIFKLWLHLDADAQESRFRALEADPLQSWRVTPRDWENWSRADELIAAAEEAIDETDTKQSRWHVIEASDDRRRAVEVGDALLEALQKHVRREVRSPRSDEQEALKKKQKRSTIDWSSEPEKTLRKSVYRRELAELQGRLNQLHRRAYESGVALVGVFEGRDAAGKGGAIRRVTAALDARKVDIVRIGAPSDEELAYHYLWRFWRRIPRSGFVTLFDRSWYGRVLAERVEELATEHEWRRAYDEINDFEAQLVDEGIVLVKFWLEIDREEQKVRFKARSRVPHKRWKLTEEDRRNRRMWKQYDDAIADMFERTSTDRAPWTIVPANDKQHARLEVLRTLVDALETRLE